MTTTVALNYNQMIEDDYSEFIKIVSKTIGDTTCFNEIDGDNYKIIHKTLYMFKEIQIELNHNDQSVKNAFSEAINGYLDFMWLLSCCRYKVSVLALRGAMEMYIKGVVRSLKLNEVNSFSNNMDIVAKKVSIIKKSEFSLENKKAKRLKNFINSNYSDELKHLYWDCSDIAHGRKETFSDFSKYMENVLIIADNYNPINHQKIMEIAREVLQLMLEFLILIEFEVLSSKMNSFKFDLILNDLGVKFKTYKDIYLV